MKDLGIRALAAMWEAFPPALRRRALFATNHHFLVGVVGIVTDDAGRVLILEHRFRTPWRWGLPGGFIDHGESLADGLKRELMEELNLQVEVDETPVDVEMSKNGRYLSMTLKARPLDTENIDFGLNPEILGGGFYDVDDLPPGTYPYHRALIQRVHNDALRPPADLV